MLNAGIPLLMGSVASAAICEEQSHLPDKVTPIEMYDVAYTEPVIFAKVSSETPFESVFRPFTQMLLQLKSTLYNYHLSLIRLNATEQEMQTNLSDPNSGEYQDASMFSILHIQALWRNLDLSSQLLMRLLTGAPRVNISWHRARQHIPMQQRFNFPDISKIITNIWKDQSKIVATYQLPAFKIDGPEMVLKLLSMRKDLTTPSLLIDNQWHRSNFMLRQELSQSIEHFYESQEVRFHPLTQKK
ncbi:hypothetical protein KSX_47100 [Ktedonospora formicarum]|uniref:Uncharacterized protein n=2 Tax=Ktedonospora formicarum TaxID=2778364 RepID=A0A8J3HYI0_9CHLR|nr:hypothetical protein KSX_47100 [Ktedonospora formicarum]